MTMPTAGIALADRAHELDTGLRGDDGAARQVFVGEHDVGRRLGEPRQRLVGGGGRVHLPALEDEGLAQDVGKDRFVLDEQQATHR